jgi:hypothetical protein
VEVDVVSLAAEFPNDNPELHRGVSWVCLDVTGAPVAILPEPEPPSVSVAELLAPPEPERIAEAVAEAVAEVAHAMAEALAEEPPVPEPRISGIVARGEVRDDEDEDEDDGEGDIVVEELPPLDETASLEGAATAVASGVAHATEVAEVVELFTATVATPPPIEVSSATELPPASDDPFTTLVSALAGVAIGAGSPYVASLLPGLLIEGRLDHALPADAAQALAEADIARGTEVTPAFVAQTRAWRAILAGTSDDFAACGNAMLDEWAAELLARLLGAPSRATALRRDVRSHGVAAFGLVEAA